MVLERGRPVGGGPPILLRGGHGLPSRASVASGPGSHEGECSGEVGGSRVSAGSQPRLEEEKGQGASDELGQGIRPCSVICHRRGSGSQFPNLRRGGDRSG